MLPKVRRSKRLQEQRQSSTYKAPNYIVDDLPADPLEDKNDGESYDRYKERLLTLQNPETFEDIFNQTSLRKQQLEDAYITARCLARFCLLIFDFKKKQKCSNSFAICSFQPKLSTRS